ncbi:MAG: hypothetical protein QXK01_08960 [Thermofilum sp.]|uniref:hypothetical protein n=1 Tax=Thermofilum sp. TaxID=1961369 RepID=UPI00315E0EDC
MRVRYVIYTSGEEEDAEVFMEFVKDIVFTKLGEMQCYPVGDTSRCEVIMPPKEPKVATYITCCRNIYRMILHNGLYFEFIGTRNALSEGVFRGIIEHKDKKNAVIRIGGKEYEAYLIEYETTTPKEWDLWPTDRIELINGKWYVTRNGKVLFEIEKKDMYEGKRCPFMNGCINVTEYCKTDYIKCFEYQARLEK